MSVTTPAAVDVVPAIGVRALDALGPGLASRAGPLLAPLVEALVTALRLVDENVTDGVVRTQPPELAGQVSGGLYDLFNLDRSPAPGWVGQWAGVPWVREMSRAQQIAAVRSRGLTRGTPAALIAAARATLAASGGRAAQVELRERDGSAYRLSVRTYAAQTPNPDATLAALLAAKPVGLLLTLTVAAGQDFHELIERGQTFADLRDGTFAPASGPTFGDLRDGVPDDTGEVSFAALAAGSFDDLAGNTWAHALRPTIARSVPTTVTSFSRLTKRTFGYLRDHETFQTLPVEPS